MRWAAAGFDAAFLSAFAIASSEAKINSSGSHTPQLCCGYIALINKFRTIMKLSASLPMSEIFICSALSIFFVL
jgi:hypothetical protein